MEKSFFLIQPGDASCHVLSSKDGSLVDLNYDEELNVHELVLSIFCWSGSEYFANVGYLKISGYQIANMEYPT